MDTARVEVLLVEAAPENTPSVAAYLNEHATAVAVETAPTAATALARLDDGAFDCLLVGGPVSDATPLDLVECVHERFPALPIVLYPIDGDETLASDALGAGAANYLKREAVADQADELAARITAAVAAATTGRPELDERLLELVEAARDILWLATADMSEILYVNRVWEDKWGHDRQTLYEDPTRYIEFMPEKSREAEREAHEQMAEWAASGDAPDQIVDEYRMATADGEYRWVKEIVIPIRDETGEVRWWGGIERDITERKRHEDQLRRQNDRLNQVASIISHDLRNPLNVLAGALEQAEQSGDPQHFEDCYWALDRIETLVEQQLAIARAETPIDEVEAVAVAAVVEDCWRSVEREEATLVVDTEQVVRADRARLQQLFENLVGNALTHGGPEVTVTVGSLDDGFYVADDGPGIPEDERAAIFDRGFSMREEGTGLGLFIVEEIVEAHGWSVRVTDSDSGGARFDITGVDVV